MRGAAFGVPLGVAALTFANSAYVRGAIGAFLIAAWLGGSGAIRTETARHFLFGLPALLACTWVYIRLYGRIDEAAFRKLALALVSGVALMV